MVARTVVVHDVEVLELVGLVVDPLSLVIGQRVPSRFAAVSRRGRVLEAPTDTAIGLGVEGNAVVAPSMLFEQADQFGFDARAYDAVEDPDLGAAGERWLVLQGEAQVSDRLPALVAGWEIVAEDAEQHEFVRVAHVGASGLSRLRSRESRRPQHARDAQERIAGCARRAHNMQPILVVQPLGGNRDPRQAPHSRLDRKCFTSLMNHSVISVAALSSGTGP